VIGRSRPRTSHPSAEQILGLCELDRPLWQISRVFARDRRHSLTIDPMRVAMIAGMQAVGRSRPRSGAMGSQLTQSKERFTALFQEA
jgi:hypothetical protein